MQHWVGWPLLRLFLIGFSALISIVQNLPNIHPRAFTGNWVVFSHIELVPLIHRCRVERLSSMTIELNHFDWTNGKHSWRKASAQWWCLGLIGLGASFNYFMQLASPTHRTSAVINAASSDAPPGHETRPESMHFSQRRIMLLVQARSAQTNFTLPACAVLSKLDYAFMWCGLQ
jgi:hypothetical protein